MDCHILVEKQPTNGYVATVMGWPDCIGTGATKDEALTNTLCS
jgi:predicted RNase H-like HicB family nuclease